MASKNTFALKSDAYAFARPRYPASLYEWLVRNVARRERAWDCATGNGQAAVDLAAHFEQVFATDVSQEQIAQQLTADNVTYSVQPAEKTTFADASFDLVTVAQALHWFDFRAFWPEVARVSRPGALFCAWGYAWFECEPDVDADVVRPFRDLIAPFWAPNNKLLWDGYQQRDIAFPMERLTTPPFAIEVRWTVPQLIAYMQTWSSYKRSQADRKAAVALSEIVDKALAAYAGKGPMQVRMPLAVVAGRVGTSASGR
jgi:SAM-dependent methyltransferase